MNLDKWQEEVLDTKGNICLRSGRQVGKSTIISIKAGKYAMEHQGITVMVIASVERQALLLFEKILSYIYNNNKKMIKKGKDRPTKHKINLINGSVIHCLPTGESGYGIRGYTINLLIADEAAFIPEDVWTAVTPMLTITRGHIWLLSTPHGKEGFYYRCFQDEKYTQFHVSSEDCPRKDQEFLDHEKEWMTKAQYAQEYLGLFVDDLRQFFPDERIQDRCIGKRRKRILDKRKYYLGVDVAQLGSDESTFEILDGTTPFIKQVENIITRKTRLTDTEDKIINLNQTYNFGRGSIGIDDAGIGAGVFDSLLANKKMSRKIVGLNNSRRSIDKDGRKKKLLKEDMYNNLLRLMERNEITLLDDDEIKLSLKSIQCEYNDKGDMKLWGNYSHITEGIIRAAWLIKNKSLNMFYYS